MLFGPLPHSVGRRAAPVLFALFGFSLLVAGPALCFAGVLEHPCGGCPESLACSHEENCSDDPCADATIPSRGTQDELGFQRTSAAIQAPFALTEADLGLATSGINSSVTGPAASPLRTGSILPLRI